MTCVLGVPTPVDLTCPFPSLGSSLKMIHPHVLQTCSFFAGVPHRLPFVSSRSAIRFINWHCLDTFPRAVTSGHIRFPSVYEREAARWRPSVWPCVSRTDRGLGTGSHPYPEADWIGSIRVDPFRSGARSRPHLDTCPGCPSEGTRGGDSEGNNRLPRPWGTPEITVFQPYWLRTVDSGNTPGLLERNPRL